KGSGAPAEQTSGSALPGGPGAAAPLLLRQPAHCRHRRGAWDQPRRTAGAIVPAAGAAEEKPGGRGAAMNEPMELHELFAALDDARQTDPQGADAGKIQKRTLEQLALLDGAERPAHRLPRKFFLTGLAAA